jgi:hypothetical protein
MDRADLDLWLQLISTRRVQQARTSMSLLLPKIHVGTDEAITRTLARVEVVKRSALVKVKTRLDGLQTRLQDILRDGSYLHQHPNPSSQPVEVGVVVDAGPPNPSSQPEVEEGPPNPSSHHPEPCLSPCTTRRVETFLRRIHKVTRKLEKMEQKHKAATLACTMWRNRERDDDEEQGGEGGSGSGSGSGDGGHENCHACNMEESIKGTNQLCGHRLCMPCLMSMIEKKSCPRCKTKTSGKILLVSRQGNGKINKLPSFDILQSMVDESEKESCRQWESRQHDHPGGGGGARLLEPR